MGYDFTWADFATIEVMSSPRFGHKRVGYLAACQSFDEDTDVILLCTNLLKKEFQSSNVYEVGLAINCLSNIVTPDLARELLPDLTNLTAHSQPYIRKKAVLCLFKVFVKYPQGLRLTFDRIKQCLDDPDSSVVSCAVNVITELADKNPRNYLLMAPAFFGLLTGSSNNWMLIKVVKLLGSLVPEEPRLARKLLEPLASIASSTQAKSLLYEAVYTLTLALPFAKKSDGSIPKSVPAIVRLCSEKLRDFVEELDQNLKYLGLVGLVSLQASNPKAVVEHRALILQCLCDDDVTIRSRALSLLTGMVTKKNLQELVDQLMQHVALSDGKYRDELIGKIIYMCARDKYGYMPDFRWYLRILVDMSGLQGTEHGEQIGGQIVDVTTRVQPVRSWSVERMAGLVTASEVAMGKSKTTITEVLHAAAWVVGEYSSLLEGGWSDLVRTLLSPESLKLAPRTQSVYVQAAFKVFAAACTNIDASGREIIECLDSFEVNLPLWMESDDIEVQERANATRNLLVELKLLAPNRSKEPPAKLINDVSPREDGDGKGQEQTTVPDIPNADFLGLEMNPISPAPVVTDSSIFVAGVDAFGKPVDDDLVALCRSHAKTILGISCPEPMRPVNAKAQKKVPVASGWELDKPIDVGAFKAMVKADAAVLKKRKLSIEEVYFGFVGSQPQQALRSASADSVDDSFEIEATARYPFESAMSQANTATSLNRADGSAFYLGEGGAGGGEDHGRGAAFGQIQLGGITDSSDDENAPSDKPKRRTKKGNKKKGKKDKNAPRETDDSFSMKADAMSIFGGSAALYASGDDSDSDAPGSGPGGSDSQFEGLAKVDLTTPLAPDEVIVERKHRDATKQAGDDQGEAAGGGEKNSRKKSKGKDKKKKGKGKKKKKGGGAESDLLDLGGGPVSAPDPRVIHGRHSELLLPQSPPSEEEQTS